MPRTMPRLLPTNAVGGVACTQRLCYNAVAAQEAHAPAASLPRSLRRTTRQRRVTRRGIRMPEGVLRLCNKKIGCRAERRSLCPWL